MRTFLPVYDRITLQDYRKSGAKKPLVTPRYRLPSMQWASAGDVTEVLLVNDAGSTDITAYFQTLPVSVGGNVVYDGTQLVSFLPTGTYYLQISTDDDMVYYSEWFKVCEVFEQLIAEWLNIDYDTFTTSGTAITSAINTTSTGRCRTRSIGGVRKGETICLILTFTLNSGTDPITFLSSVSLFGTRSNIVTLASGVNFIELTATQNMSDACVRIGVSDASNFSTGEILVYREYSEDFLKIDFSNTCDIGDLVTPEGVLFLEDDIGESFYEELEEAQENGNGELVPTFRRQEKRYIIRTGLQPEYVVDALYMMKLFDDVTITDKYGVTTDMKNIDIVADWQFEEKYFLLTEIHFNRDEIVIVTGCDC